MSTTIMNSLIVETPRGPSIAGTRITVYAVMDYLKGDWSRHFTKQMLGITDEQLDAVLEYIAQRREEVERDYAEILRRAEELRARYEEQNLARSPFPPGMPIEEQRQLMLQKLEQMKNGSANSPHDPAGQ
ncbi:MAG: DUF433 domain-containing protein [Verrucomicrobiales bacterium]|nr:DUF433 domain-containing protein [Verrucomicrobiales bacterium]